MEAFFNIENSLGLLVKVGATIGFGFYLVFAFVMIKQVGKMTETLEVGMETLLRAIALLHFLVAIGALFVTLAIL